MKKIILIIIPILIVIIGTLIFLKEPKVIFTEKTEVNLNSEVYINEFVKKVYRGKVTNGDKKVDTSSSGKFKIIIEIENIYKQKIKIEYEIEIIDNQELVIEAEDKITIQEGDDINLLDNATVKNNSDIKIEIIGDYDINKPGIYELKYVANDGNKTAEKHFTLEVTKKEQESPVPSTNPNSTSIVSEPQPSNTSPTTTTSVSDGTFTTSKGFSGVTKNGITYIDGILVVNKTYSLPSTYSPGGLTPETQEAADKMFAAAKLEGLNMWAQSGFRSYSTQSYLYNNYVSYDGKTAADRYSARPGHSEHQSGLAFDVCMSGYGCINSTFDNTPPANWIASNAYKYGFILRFPKGKENETGYMYESWHLRYVGIDLATKLYNNGDWITLEDYFGITSVYNY